MVHKAPSALGVKQRTLGYINSGFVYFIKIIAIYLFDFNPFSALH